jgi:hypothetical protein
MSEAATIWSEERLSPGKDGDAEKAGHRTTFEQDYDAVARSGGG